MKFGMTLGAILLASNLAFAQAALDMSTLERRYEDAQAAFDRDPSRADRQQLDDLRDELGYLRVKQRRGDALTRAERQRFSDNLDRFLTRIGSGRSSSDSYGDRRDRRDRNDRYDTRNDRIGSTQRLEIPSAAEVDVRLETALSSDTAQPEDRVEATTLVDLRNGGSVVVPAGSTLLGWVTSVNKAGRVDRKGSVTVEFNRIRINGRTYDTRAYVTQALESEGIKGDAGKIGTGAGVGAIIGGILGGVKGAIAGILIGGGGVIAATEGQDVNLPQGTVLRVRFDAAVPLGY